MTATTLPTCGNLVFLPGVVGPARSIVTPRRARSFWRKPWWWRDRLYWLVPSSVSLRKRLRTVELALMARRIQPDPSASRPPMWLVPGGGAA
jgi:hypothetical protein